jgi:hypothetical protein
MSDALEEIAAQTSKRVNERTKRGKINWDFPPNLEHTHVAYETKPASAPPSNGKRAAAPTVSKRNSANLGRLITDYRTLVDTCRARADELELSRLEIDRLSGLPTGYAGKILGKDGSEPGKKHKKMWPIALESMLGVLGLKILLIEGDAATARTLALRTPVDRANQRFGNVSRLTPMLLTPPSHPAAEAKDPKPASRSHLRVIQGKRRGGKYG